MKKNVLKLATIICLFFTISFSTQAQFMEKGDVLGSGGFYFPSGLTLLNVGVDFGVADNVSVGGRFVTVLSKGSKGSYIGGRVAYHLGEAFGVKDSRSLDPYAAFQVGKVLSSEGSIGLNIPLGLRFMFNEKFGAYAEYMIDLNSEALDNQFGLGISFRFNN
jgi:hypothetical protein